MPIEINLADITDHRIEYPLASSQEFLTLDDYLLISEKVISYYCNASLAYRLLNSSDALAFIAEQLIMADWRWKPKCKIKKIKDNEIIEEEVEIDRYNYRNLCAKYAIKTYLKRSKNKKNARLMSFDEHERFCIEVMDDREIDKERQSKLLDIDNTKKIQYLINNSMLSNIQKQCIRLHFLKELTLEKTGNILGISKQGVQQSIVIAIEKMRVTAGVTNTQETL